MEKEDLPPISEKLNYNPKDVFISWNHRDRNYLEAILDIFSSTKDSQEGEITTWNSEFGGDCVGDLGYVISHNIPLCKAFLLILSPNCLKSEWTLREYLTAAKDPRIGINHILPVIVSPLDYDNLDKWNPELYKDNPKDYALIKTFVERLNKETASMFSFSHYINKDKESLIEKMREILLNRAMVDIHNVKETFSVKKFYPELSFNDAGSADDLLGLLFDQEQVLCLVVAVFRGNVDFLQLVTAVEDTVANLRHGRRNSNGFQRVVMHEDLGSNGLHAFGDHHFLHVIAGHKSTAFDILDSGWQIDGCQLAGVERVVRDRFHTPEHIVFVRNDRCVLFHLAQVLDQGHVLFPEEDVAVHPEDLMIRRNLNVFQRKAGCESLVSDLCHAVRNIDGFQFRTVFKRTVFDLL